MAPSIPKSMKALQLQEFRKNYRITEIPVPAVGENDVLIKTGAAGFCHTDYQVWQGVYGTKLPIAGSHEPVGTIVSVGSIAASKWEIGHRVGVLLFRHPCHKCQSCLTTRDIRFCETGDRAGLLDDGGFAEYIIGDANNICLLPDSIPFEQAAPLMCAGATVWSGILQTGLPPGSAIAIVGIGGLGSLGVQLSKALGYRVVAIDNRTEGRDLAVEFTNKAGLVLDSTDPSALDKAKSFAGEGGFLGVVVCTDDVPVNEWALELLRPHGIFVPLGVPTDGFKVSAFSLHFKELTVKGSLVGTQKDTQEMLEVVAKHGIKNHLTVLSFEEAENLPERYMDAHLKGRLVVKY